MSDIVITKHEDFVLILMPYAPSINKIKDFFMENLDLLMKNNLIWDIRGTGKIPLDSDYIWGMLEMLKAFPNPGGHKRDAIVASLEEQLDSLREMIKIFKEHELSPNVECFGHLESAVKWVRSE